MKTRTFGIEIEMNRISRATAARVIAGILPANAPGDPATIRHIGGACGAYEACAADGRKWKLVSDVSIAGDRDQSTEFVSPICRREDTGTVQACIRALRAAGAHAAPNSRPIPKGDACHGYMTLTGGKFLRKDSSGAVKTTYPGKQPGKKRSPAKGTPGDFFRQRRTIRRHAGGCFSAIRFLQKR